jgi:hypothetical protein
MSCFKEMRHATAITKLYAEQKTLIGKSGSRTLMSKTYGGPANLEKNPLSDGGSCHILTLHKKSGDNEILHTYTTDEEKADAFAAIFFPPKPPALPDMLKDTEMDPHPLPFNMPWVHQIVHRIEKTSAYKAPGNDGIPNAVLKSCVSLISPILLTCLHAILRLQYFPHSWREWTTVVI